MDMIKEMTDRGVDVLGTVIVPEDGANGVGLEISKNGQPLRMMMESKHPITDPEELDGVAFLLKDWAEEKLAS